MDLDTLVATRRSLHGIAEHVVAGPQHRRFDTIRIVVRPGGYRGLRLDVGIEGADLVWDLDGRSGRAPLRGTYRDLAGAAGVDAGRAVALYTDDSGTQPDDEVAVDPEAAALLAACWERGDAALRTLAPDAAVILWPEHFDVGIGVAEVNYGMSSGDDFHPEPYAYVGPWSFRESPLGGDFWNAPFGAVRPASDLPDAATVLAFFEDGRRRAAG